MESPASSALLQHEARLRQRALGSVDQQQDAVDHRERAFDLAAEVGMAGRIDDIDAHAAPSDRGILGHDGDAALALQRERVHHALGDMFVGAEYAGLAQQRVDQRRFTVVDVGHDGEIADILSSHLRALY